MADYARRAIQAKNRQERESGMALVLGAASTANASSYSAHGLGDKEMMGLGRVGISQQRQLEAGILRQAQGDNYKEALDADEFNPLAAPLAGFFADHGTDKARQTYARKKAKGGAWFADMGIYGKGMDKNWIRPDTSFGTGGPVHGFGSGDKVNALLASGEHVISAQAASRIGHGNLSNMQSAALGGPGGGGSTSGFNDAVEKFLRPAGDFSKAVTDFGRHVTKFEDAIQKLGEITERFNGTVKVEGTQIVQVAGSVTVTGGSGGENAAVEGKVKDQVGESFRRKMPDYF